MSFRVEPSFLDGYAGQVHRAGDDAAEIKKCLSGHPQPQSGGGNGVNALILPVADVLERSMTASLAAIEKVTSTLHASGTGLTEAAGWYRHTDAAAAARMDATLPTTGTCVKTGLEQQWAGNPCAPSFADSREPSSRLVAVPEVEFSHPMSWMDYTSVSNYMLEAFDHVFGFNPLERATDSLLGDWQAVAKAGVAFGHAADAMQDLGYNIQGGAIALKPGWEGIAADTAYYRFTRLADGAANLAGPFREISKQFTEIAHGVYNTTEAVNGFLKGLADAAIIAGIAFVAGTATAASGVGAVVGYSVSAVEVANMLRLWAQATAAINGIYGMVQAAVGIIEGQIARIADAVPDMADYTAYRHPQVPAWVGAR
ncbi:hypothetical protein [Couchioplanes caeruleus]|uniref:Excreted virulence factor EspC (Type VII ESX diderm) n=2 Tax=Couchioplanes caeruleus TaxID=56438 RepID=A0A1K0FJI4_9ACTN|nr:hypothetical protein [Couchioplanes caeruleus]OJF13005.1 hypothetical protein BG844_17700 [Couchioplanes caeruleus subsp. caeruleus]ROP33605.1 hypothetical protein EDD30_6620 [Couchioplanes caeruleus]